MSRIEGERIVLREYLDSDLDAVYAWTQNPSITENLSEVFYLPQTLKATEEYLLEASRDRNRYAHIIADKQTNRYIGQIDFIELNWIHRWGELGIVIGNRKDQGKGIGKEALRLFLGFSFFTLNLERVQLKVHDYNFPAINCYKKCGFVEEGRQRRAFFYNNRYTDWILMSILKDEFEGLL